MTSKLLWFLYVIVVLGLFGGVFVVYVAIFARHDPPHDWWQLGWGVVLFGVCLLLALLPPKYDPAILLKERNERKNQK